MEEYRVSENDFLELLTKFENLFDSQSKILVGILLKRIEVLEQEKTLSVPLYKALVKETIYEQFRNLKEITKLYLTIGKITFKSSK
jgi:hypothetical protein